MNDQVVIDSTFAFNWLRRLRITFEIVLNFAVLIFSLKVTGNDESERKIVIDFNVTIKDHPKLANNSKHWVGAGMRSGYQMLWVGQEALFVYKVCQFKMHFFIIVRHMYALLTKREVKMAGYWKSSFFSLPFLSFYGPKI